MTRRRKSPRRSRKKKSGVGRFIEGMGVLVLLLVVLTFGISIAARFLPGEGKAGAVESQIQASNVAPEPSDLSLEGGRPVVVVENGCGTPGLAREFSEEVRELDVIDYLDADRYDYEHTVIVANEAHQDEARAVLRQLTARYNVGRIDLSQEPSLLAPVKVILGRDLAEVWARRTSETR